ncbi:MAG: DUF3285 domain-containing protein [Hormoscilla sp. GUM202]|nr:DUF3285 domain-containing protein [Hormoscilla sp. GUM202]
MSQSSDRVEAPVNAEPVADQEAPAVTEPQASYVKLAMRNMVRKGGTSLKHFALTTVGLVGILILLSYLTR